MTTNSYPVVWVPLEKLSELRNETRDQIMYRVNNDWADGVHFKKIMKGKRYRYEFNIPEIDKWITNQKSVA